MRYKTVIGFWLTAPSLSMQYGMKPLCHALATAYPTWSDIRYTYQICIRQYTIGIPPADIREQGTSQDRGLPLPLPLHTMCHVCNLLFSLEKIAYRKVGTLAYLVHNNAILMPSTTLWHTILQICRHLFVKYITMVYFLCNIN